MLNFDINTTKTTGIMRYSIKTTISGDVENSLIAAVSAGIPANDFIQLTIAPRARRMLLDMANGYKNKIEYVYMNVAVAGRSRPSYSSGDFMRYVLIRWGRSENGLWPSIYVGLYPPAEKRHAMEAFEVTGSAASDYVSMTEHKASLLPWVIEKLGIPEGPATVTNPGRNPYNVKNLAQYVAGAVAQSNYRQPFPPADIFGIAKREFVTEQNQILQSFLLDLRAGLPITPGGLDAMTP